MRKQFGFFILSIKIIMDKKYTTQEMIDKFKELGIAGEVEFYFVPSARLKQLIVQGGDSVIDKLPPLSKKCILELQDGQGMAIYTPTVLKYIAGTLDKNNSYIFDMGEIRVQNEGQLLLKAMNQSKKMRQE
jgi:hypothetical protein